MVSDCGAIDDIFAHHKVVATAEEAAALAVKAGCDLNCGQTYVYLLGAVEQGLISEAEIDRALERLLRTRFRLGLFDPPERVPYARTPYAVNDCEAHRRLALEVARQSLVLLKNAAGTLPLDGVGHIAVVGPNADDPEVLLGNYSGTPSRSVTPLEGIRAAAAARGVEVQYARGCDLLAPDQAGFPEALTLAREADLVVAVMGISQMVEGEEHPGKPWADRDEIGLPAVQEALLQALAETGKPLVVVLLNGSALAVNWAAAHAAAILEAWYPGEEGGTAIAEALWGDYNPAGRLPVTFYTGVDQLPPFEQYDMRGFTYRYFEGEPLYPFGYGLSYTTFQYSDLRVTPRVRPGQTVNVTVRVENTGARAGDEVVQLYVRDEASAYPTPIRRLAGFERIHLAPGESRRVGFTLGRQEMLVYDDDGEPLLEPGVFSVSVGGGQPIANGGAPYLIAPFELLP